MNLTCFFTNNIEHILVKNLFKDFGPLCVYFFLAQSHSITKDSAKLVILTPQLLKYWAYRHVPDLLTYLFNLFRLLR